MRALVTLLFLSHFSHAIVVVNDNEFSVSLFVDISSPQDDDFLHDIPSFDSLELGLSSINDVVMYLKHSRHSQMLIHLFVVSPTDMSNNRRITLPRLLSPTWLDGMAAVPAELPRRPSSVSPYHSTAPEATCVLLRSLSSRPVNVITVENGTPSSWTILQPGALGAVWVVEPDTVIGYSDLDGSGDQDMYLKVVTPRGDSGINLVLSDKYPAEDASLLQLVQDHEFFMEAYDKAYRRQWLAKYDEEGPHLGHAFRSVWPMWPAEYVGQVHLIASDHHTVIPAVPGAPRAGPIIVSPRTLKLQAISVTPRAFVVEDFLSVDEADALLALAGKRPERPGRVDVDGVNFLAMPPRTSMHACMRREDHALVETIFVRAADIFGVSEELLYPYGAAGLSKDLQLIYYNTSGKFVLHSDSSLGNSALRLITILIYLNDQASPTAGGETAFPRGGYKVRPTKGTALMYYNLLEDGNVDIDAQHESLAVVEGEKWAASLYLYATPTRYRAEGAPAQYC